jgi:hypothetical protein
MGNRSLYTITGDVLTLTGVMSWHVSSGGFASGGGRSKLATVLWLDGCLGVEPKIGLALAEDSMIGCRRAVPLFICILAFALQLRKSRKTSVRVAVQCWVLHVASTWQPCRGGLYWPAVHPSRLLTARDFRQPLTDVGANSPIPKLEDNSLSAVHGHKTPVGRNSLVRQLCSAISKWREHEEGRSTAVF